MEGHRVILISILLAASACASRAHSGAHGPPGAHVAPPLPPRLAGAKPQLTPPPGEPLAIRLSASHGAYTPSRRTVHVKLDYATAAPGTDRPPLNIALVLDRSGSMGDEHKLAYTVEAARWVIANLTERDTLSIVAFSDGVEVVAPAAHVTNRQYFLHRLDEIHADGRTDVSAGLLEGIAQIDQLAAPDQVRQVLVLTDGMANVGVTEPSRLAQIADKARTRGIGVSTLGCGDEFDEQVLAQIASAGGGRYTYVKSPEQIPQAFKEELRGLLAVVAQNVVLRIDVTGGAIAKLYGQVPIDPVPGYELQIGNLRADERGLVLVELAADKLGSGGAMEVRVALVFDDVEAGARRRVDTAARLVFAEDGDPVARAGNDGVLIYAGLLDAIERVEAAVVGRDQRSYRDAAAQFARWHGRALQQAAAAGDQQLADLAFMLDHFTRELDELARGGELHDHPEAQTLVGKRGHYERYMLLHHRDEHPDDH